MQDQLASTPSGRFYSINPIELLWRAVKSKCDDYDVVIVDCPPNLGMITLNGLRISQGYIILTILDILSTYGIPRIVTRVREFSQEIAEPIEPPGIAITKYRAQSTTHINGLRRLKGEEDAGKGPHLFDTVIPETDAIAAAAEHLEHQRTLKGKYPRGLADSYRNLARETLTKLES